MEIKNIVVVGGGTMGHGIAQTYAGNGFKTTLVDVKPEALETAKNLVTSSIKTMLDADFITAEQAKSVETNLFYTTDIGVAADADLVVEAVPEDPDLKKSIFTKLDGICRKDTILTSTTSAMNIYEFVKVSNIGRLLIAHWCNPPHILPLVEIVAGPETDSEVVLTMRKLLEELGKSPVVLKEPVPGFIINRLNLALMRECSYMVEQGWVSPEDVDIAYCCNQGMKAPFEGPLRMMDFIGWDIGCMAGMFLYPSISNATEVGPLALQMLDEERLGVKVGRGLYDYSGKTIEEIQQAREAHVLEVVKLARKLKAEK